MRQSCSFVIWLSGSIALHMLALNLAFDRAIPGQRFRVSAQPLQMTMYVALGEAHAAAHTPLGENDTLEPDSLAGASRPGSGAIGSPTPKARPAPRAQDLQDETLSTFLPSSQMDRAAVPISEPDSELLNGIQSSGLPIKLRIYVNASGVVTDIHVIQADDMDMDAVKKIKAMFFATAFIAGRRKGVDVPSYMDIELTISDFARTPPFPTR